MLICIFYVITTSSNLYEQIRELELEVTEVKESMANASEDLRIMVSCFKEIQLQRAMKRKLEQKGMHRD